jgi:uncharacterized membrane protein YqjE
MATDTNGRSISSVLHDIVQNMQDIVRSQLRLARIELGEEIAKAKTAGILLAMGAVSGALAVLFALLAAVFALSRVMPDWAAALIVAGVIGIVGGVMFSAGRRRLREVHPIPGDTVETVKEDVQWAKQLTK